VGWLDHLQRSAWVGEQRPPHRAVLAGADMPCAWRLARLVALASDFLSDALDHPFDHPDDPSVSVWTDEASNVSRPDPSGADQIDAEHPTRNRKVEGSNPSSGSKTLDQSIHICSPDRRD
jgi:hypothetical protein